MAYSWCIDYGGHGFFHWKEGVTGSAVTSQGVIVPQQLLLLLSLSQVANQFLSL